MKKRMALILLFLGFTHLAFSQTSIGFKNPKNIQSLLSYRLPTWGYSTFIISTSGQTLNSNRKYSNDETSKRFYSQLHFNPNFAGYHESDNSINSFSAGLTSNFEFDRSKTIPPTDNDRKNMRFYSSLMIAGSLSRYYYKNAFFSGSLSLSNRYEDSKATYLTTSNTSHQIRRTNQLGLRVGTGIGRVRDVTPMIRALRFQERYAAIQNISPFNDTQLQFLAHEIAKRSGYQRVYDRSDKHFWSHLFEGIGVESTLSPYEIYYLSDLFKENVGVRLEGWDISTGVTWNYSNDEFYRRFGGYGQIRWYKNLNLNHQIGVNAFGSLRNYLSDKAISRVPLKYFGEIDLKLSYLWVITDRVLWQSTYTSDFGFAKYKNKNSQQTSNKNQNFNHRLYSELSYYIEDNLSFFIRTNILLSRLAKDFYFEYQKDEFDLSFGVVFYVDRKLK